jgi:hypothetical protein
MHHKNIKRTYILASSTLDSNANNKRIIFYLL